MSVSFGVAQWLGPCAASRAINRVIRGELYALNTFASLDLKLRVAISPGARRVLSRTRRARSCASRLICELEIVLSRRHGESPE